MQRGILSLDTRGDGKADTMARPVETCEVSGRVGLDVSGDGKADVVGLPTDTTGDGQLEIAEVAADTPIRLFPRNHLREEPADALCRTREERLLREWQACLAQARAVVERVAAERRAAARGVG